MPFEDRVQAGWIGAIGAVEHFDPTRGVALQTYAEHRIRGAILDSLRELDHLSRWTRRTINAINAIESTETTDEQIAEQLGVCLKNVRWARFCGRYRVVSWPCIDEDGEDVELGYKDRFADCLADVDEAKKLTEFALKCLSERTRRVVRMYYFDGLPMHQIGRRVGVIECRISQILSSARRTMLKAINDQELKQEALKHHAKHL